MSTNFSDTIPPVEGKSLPVGIRYQYDNGQGWRDDHDVPPMFPSDYCLHYARHKHPALLRARVFSGGGTLLFLRWFRSAERGELEAARRRGEREQEFESWRCAPMDRWYSPEFGGLFE